MECKDLKTLCWVLAIFVTSTSARFLNDTENENSSEKEGICFYNGTWYEEKEELPTRGLCLICHCFPGFTEPNAFTCSVIDCPWEDYHKRFPGCTPIYADRDCCPIGWECDYGTQNPGQQLSRDPSCDCEWRYLKHYEAKGCRPVYEEKPRPNGDKPQCTCPWRFDCSQADEVNADEKVCLYKKHVYPVGSKIPTTNPCESCSCTKDYFTEAATITCTTAECPSVYSQTPLPEGCHYVYKENQCCPTSVECPAAQKENTFKVPICEYKGKMFYEGEQIYPDEDPCLICLCSQNWTGVNSSSCRQHDCMLERDSRKLKQGCIPIYHEKTCCPIDYHCADDDLDFKANRGANFKAEDDEDEMCHFEGRYYPVAHVLDIKHPTHCVTCICKTPPDFTCIHSSCPPPPNGDYANCRAVYKPNACCPDYKCHEKKGPSCPDPICQGTNCWLETREDGCAVCRCKSRCVPCPDMCKPENPTNPCSGCICQINATALTHEFENAKKDKEPTEEVAGDSLQILIQECKKMQCAADERCMLVEKKCESEPCQPVPQCEKVSFGCGQKSCPADCEEIGSYEGSCPICYCKKENKEPQYKLTCHVQSCEENCVLTGRDKDGCPLCKCPQGNLEERACAESYCKGYNCTMTVNPLGCAECRCQLSCKPRECPVGCDMDLDVPKDNGLECGCTCKNSTTAVEYINSKSIPEGCQPVSCQGLNCTVGENQSGCPTCACKSPCPEPKCQDGCQLEKEVKEPGRCPGCACKLSRSARDNTAKECPPPTCLGYNCSVIAGEDGCQRCVCESPCEDTPQCPSHCKLETDIPEGRCRGCICSFGENTDSEGKPLGDEYEDHENLEGEPEKREDEEADFIPLPSKDIVPGVDKIYLIHGDADQDQYAGVAGYHYDGGHAYPVAGEHLESGLYNAGGIPGEHHDESEDLYGEASEDRHDFAEYEDDDKYEPEFAEEKTIDDDEDDKCAQKNCPEGQKCVIRRLQCIRTPCPTIPVCIDVEPRCPIPMCSIGCMVMKWDDEVCPSCFCGIIRGAEGRVCPRTRCVGRRCYNVIGDDGCPSCKCDSICIPPTCNDGCWIETESPEGKCPTCRCPSRSTIVPQIIQGTSPAIATTGRNIDQGSDGEIAEDSRNPSEDYENIEDKPIKYIEDSISETEKAVEEVTSRPTEAVTQQQTSTKSIEEKIPSTPESQTLDFYDSLAEIEQQIKSKDQLFKSPTVLENLDLFETSTGIITDDIDFDKPNTFNHHSPMVTGTQLSETISYHTRKPSRRPDSPYKQRTTLTPTTEKLTQYTEATNDLLTEITTTTSKPLISHATASSPEETNPVVLSLSNTTPTTNKEMSIKETTVTEGPQRIQKPISTRATRKPQRKPSPQRRKPSVQPSTNKYPQRIRPQESNRVKPRPQMQLISQTQQHRVTPTETKSTNRPLYQAESHKRKPTPKPQIIQETTEAQPEANNTNEDSNMKPILQNLQQLMSNLNNVLSNHQIIPTSEKDQADIITTTSAPENKLSNLMGNVANATDASVSKQGIQSETSDVTTINKEQSVTLASGNNHSDNDQKSEQNFKNKNSDEQKNGSGEKDSEIEKGSVPQFLGIQNSPYQQQYYLNNPNIQSLLASHQLLSNPQFAHLFQPSVNPQFHMFPPYSYQSSGGGIQPYGYLHQPPFSNVPYQSQFPHPSPTMIHSQSPVVRPLGGQTSEQIAQHQNPFYTNLQQPTYPSNVASTTDSYSHSSPHIINPHLLLTNIPIPPSLQQQLNAGTQTLGVLQYYLNQGQNPSQQTIVQNKNQQNPSLILKTTVAQSDAQQVAQLTQQQNAQQVTQLTEQHHAEQNIFQTQQPIPSTGHQQNLNLPTSAEVTNQDSQLNISTQQISSNEPQINHTNQDSLKQKEENQSVVQTLQSDNTEEHTMPPFPESATTTVPTSVTENIVSTTSVFYEGGNSNPNVNSQSIQPTEAVVPVVQQFNHHAPQVQQTSSESLQAMQSPALNQQMHQHHLLQSYQQQQSSTSVTNLEKHPSAVQEQIANIQPQVLINQHQSSIQQQIPNSLPQILINQHQSSVQQQIPNTQPQVLINQHQPQIHHQQHGLPQNEQISQQINQNPSSSESIPAVQQSTNSQIPSEYHPVPQQDSNYGVHVTSHFRPFNASQQSVQWQQDKQSLSIPANDSSDYNKIHSSIHNQIASTNEPYILSEEKYAINSQTNPTSEGHLPSLVSEESSKIPFDTQQSLPRPQDQVYKHPNIQFSQNQQFQTSQNSENKISQGQQIQGQVPNLQDATQYQQNFYQQYQNTPDKSQEQDALQSLPTIQHNLQYQKPENIFVNSENKAPYQQQYQNQLQSENIPSQQQSMQHYISNHNRPIMQVQSPNKPQFVNAPNEVPSQFQQNVQQIHASSLYQPSSLQEQQQYVQQDKLQQQTQIPMMPQTQTVFQLGQQNMQNTHLMQSDGHLPQQDQQSIHHQYTIQTNRPLKDQLNVLNAQQQSYFIQTPQQYQQEQVLVASQPGSSAQSAQFQTDYVSGSNPSITQLTKEIFHGESTLSSQQADALNTHSLQLQNVQPASFTAQQQQQQNIQSVYSTAQQQQNIQSVYSPSQQHHQQNVQSVYSTAQQQQQQHLPQVQEKPQTQYLADTLNNQQFLISPNIPISPQHQTHVQLEHNPVLNVHSQTNQQYEVQNDKLYAQQHLHPITATQDKQTFSQIQSQFQSTDRPNQQQQQISSNTPLLVQQNYQQQFKDPNIIDPPKHNILQQPQLPYSGEGRPPFQQQSHHLIPDKPISQPQIQQSQYLSPEKQPSQPQIQQQSQYLSPEKPLSQPQIQQQYPSGSFIQTQYQQQYIAPHIEQSVPHQETVQQSVGGQYVQHHTNSQQMISQNKPLFSEDRIPDRNSQGYIIQQEKPAVHQSYLIQEDESIQQQQQIMQQQQQIMQQQQQIMQQQQQIQHHTAQLKPPIVSQTTFGANNQHSTQLQQNHQQYLTSENIQNKLPSQHYIQQFANIDEKPQLLKDETQKLRPSLVATPQQQIPQLHQGFEQPEQHYINKDESHKIQVQQTYLVGQNDSISQDDMQVHLQNHEPETEFTDISDESTLSQQHQQEFKNEYYQSEHVIKDELDSSYQQIHEQYADNDPVQQQYNDDTYSALKPLTQITTAESQVNDYEVHPNGDDMPEISSDEVEPIQHVLANLNAQQNETDIQLSQQSVPPFDPVTQKHHGVKTRPGVTVHPQFHPVGYNPSPEPETDSHDLFPAPSRPFKHKPDVQQDDWVDQEFVEEDMPQEVAFDDEEYDFYETTLTTTTTTTEKPVTPSKRKPSRRPPIRFSPSTPSTTTNKPYQQEFVESFDNHQPDYNKPVDHQEFIDDSDTTTPKKHLFVRSTTTQRPSTKSPTVFASLPTVSPTAEAYGMKQQYSTKTPINPLASYHCPTPHCNGYNCSLIRGSDGCQKCVCDSPCAPCPQHCFKTKTLSEGRCPICDCTVAPTSLSDPTRQCPVVDCGGSNCRKVKDNDGCYTCICDPKCAEPKCDPGCEVLTNVPPGQCPGCVCRVTVVQAVVNRPKKCPTVDCSRSQCHTTRGPDGCLQCVCESCPPPKCDPGCELQRDVAQGQCPTCVCPSYNDDDEDQDEGLYCPNLFCSDYGCREIPGPAGCPICMCDPICATPKCEPGCQIVTNKYMGRCPVCICSSPMDSDVNDSVQSSGSHDNIKNVQQPIQQSQSQVTFSGLIEPVVAEQDPAHSTLHTTVTVDMEATQTTEEPTSTTEEEATTEMMTTTDPPTTACPASVCSGLRCAYTTNENGCEVCTCRYKCPTPKCVGNCYAETNAPGHRCPGCVCPSTRRKPPNKP